MKINNLMKSFKPFSLVIAVVFSVGASGAFAEDVMDADTINTSWMSPLAAEFATLDTSGNGLLLPHEASKGKAFNKKTFAEADTDHDGTIDLNEYIQFKTNRSSTEVHP